MTCWRGTKSTWSTFVCPQHCITMSSCEAELVALAYAAIELLYIRGLLEFIGFEQDGPVKVFTDNKGAYDLCHDRYTSAQN